VPPHYLRDAKEIAARFDPRDCRVERIRLVKKMTYSFGSRSITSPPLRINLRAALNYTIHRTYPERQNFSIPCTSINYKRHFANGEVAFGFIWMTDSLSDDFLILWGLYCRQPPSLLPIYDYDEPSWWAKGTPWCCIIDKPEGQKTSFLGFFKRNSQPVFDRIIPPDMTKKSCTSTRPTGSQIYLRIEPVDFLGRRTFDLQIQTLSPEIMRDGAD
jgi:hypothetical protein